MAKVMAMPRVRHEDVRVSHPAHVQRSTSAASGPHTPWMVCMYTMRPSGKLWREMPIAATRPVRKSFLRRWTSSVDKDPPTTDDVKDVDDDADDAESTSAVDATEGVWVGVRAATPARPSSPAEEARRRRWRTPDPFGVIVGGGDDDDKEDDDDVAEAAASATGAGNGVPDASARSGSGTRQTTTPKKAMPTKSQTPASIGSPRSSEA